MASMTRLQLDELFGQDSYQQCDHNNFYCEMLVDDEFHISEMSGEMGGSYMFRLKEAHHDTLYFFCREHDVSGGAIICETCYNSLTIGLRPEMSDEMFSRMQRTRKSLKLPSVPPRVRRIPA